MAVYRIFYRPMKEAAKLSPSISYQFDDNRLKVDWNGRTFYYNGIKEDAAFYIKTKKEAPPTVAFLTPPRSNADLVGWLAGFNAHQRTANADEYERVYLCEAIRRPWMKRVESSGHNWRYSIGIDRENQKHFVCVFITRGINKEQTIEFFKSVWSKTTPKFPPDYRKKLLQSRLGFTTEDCNDVGLESDADAEEIAS